MIKKRVVVTGMGLVSCFGSDVPHFYQSLLEGKSGVTLIDAFPVQDYPTRFAAPVRNFDADNYIEKKTARRLDPFAQYAIVAGKKALEHAGLSTTLDTLDKTKCGILIGSGMGGMSVFYEGTQVILNKGYKRLSPFFVPYIITNMGGALLAIDIGFMGPNYSISTACASANYAIYSAAEHIRKGEADVMLAGGAESAINPVGFSGFNAIKALSTRNEAVEKASCPWDKNRDGFVMGEGAGVIVLESLDHALARGATILAEYIDGAISCDAYHMTDPHKEGLGVQLCIENALRKGGIAKERVNYINAHATSTIVGDAAEAISIKNTFKEHASSIKINGTKSMIGHCLGAAAAMEAIVIIEAIRTGELHPTINIENLDECAAGLHIVTKREKHKIDVAVSNSFGFGGHNSCLLFAPFSAS